MWSNIGILVGILLCQAASRERARALASRQCDYEKSQYLMVMPANLVNHERCPGVKRRQVVRDTYGDARQQAGDFANLLMASVMK
jgi:hypothetical protein